MKISFLTFLLIFVFSFTAFAQTENERDKGIEFYRQGDYAKAVEVLQNYLKAEDKDRIAWLYLGASFVKLKKDNDAVKAFRKSNGRYEKNLPVYEKELKIISKPRPNYTDAARQNQVSGIVKVTVEFGADGTIGFVFPLQDLPDGLTESTIEAAKAIKFEAAVKDGKPVAVVKTLEYSFLVF